MNSEYTPPIPSYERREIRLVTMRVPARITFSDGTVMAGLTTGLNKNGMGLRIALPAPGTAWSDQQLINQNVSVSLDLTKKDFAPILGTILRVENSWEPGFDRFCVVQFQNINFADVEFLREFIHWREIGSFTEIKPQREWYTCKDGSQEITGPATVAELKNAMTGGSLTEQDWLWYADLMRWVRLGEGTVTDTFRLNPLTPVSQTKNYKIMIGGAIIILLGAGLAGFGIRHFFGTGTTGKPDTIIARQPPPVKQTNTPAPTDTKAAENNPVPVAPGTAADAIQVSLDPEIKLPTDKSLPDSDPPPHGSILVADFDKDWITEREYTCVFGSWCSDPSDPTIKCLESYDPVNRLGDKGYALKLWYDIESPNSAYGGTWLQFKGAVTINGQTVTHLDLREFRNLVIYIRGTHTDIGFSTKLKVEIKSAGEMSSVIIKNIDNVWQKFVIPLKYFDKITDWSKITELTTVLDEQVCDDKEGILYFDDIMFTR